MVMVENVEKRHNVQNTPIKFKRYESFSLSIQLKRKRRKKEEKKYQEKHYQRSNGNRILVYYLIWKLCRDTANGGEGE
jgi:hypothetical protein